MVVLVRGSDGVAIIRSDVGFSLARDYGAPVVLGTVLVMTISNATIDQPVGPPFLVLPISPVRQRSDDVSTGDEDYFVVTRYLDSAPVVLTLGSAELATGGGWRTEFRTDGVCIWDNLEHDQVLRRPVFFAYALAERARRSYGVCPVLSEDVIEAATAQVLAELRMREYERAIAALD